MTTASLASWAAFYTACAGAGAALAGLVIVAVSVNVKTIIGIPGMAARAGATISSLVLIVIASALGLIPGQTDLALGFEMLAASAIALAIAVNSAVKMFPGTPERRHRVLEAAAKSSLQLVPVAAFVIGSVLLITGSGAGFGWVALGVILAFAGCVLDAWVVLVEILR
jgi:hypothetical protein